MGRGNPLSDAVVSPGSGASFAATRHAGIVRIEPLMVAAGDWLHGHVAGDAIWDGDALVMGTRCFPDLADAIVAAGSHSKVILRLRPCEPEPPCDDAAAIR